MSEIQEVEIKSEEVCLLFDDFSVRLSSKEFKKIMKEHVVLVTYDGVKSGRSDSSDWSKPSETIS